MSHQLQKAHLQRRYRPIVIGFVVLVSGTFGGVLYAGSSQTVITVTPLRKTVSTTFPLTLGPDTGNDNELAATITATPLKETIEVKPTGLGTLKPAHASGTITLHNESPRAQPLATGTRLQARNGVIVRIQERVDLPPGKTLTTKAVADPVGKEGEIGPGRLTIVALWPGLQNQIYGTTEIAFTGGNVPESGTLSLEELTATSNQAEQKIRQTFGASTSGIFRALEPVSVASDPASETRSATYRVTVAMKGISASYSADAVATMARQHLQDRLAADEQLLAVEEPVLRFEEQPSSEAVLITVEVKGTAAIAPTSPILQPNQLTNLDAPAVVSKLLGSKAIKQVDVRIAPSWKRTTPSQVDRIKVMLTEAAP